MEIFTGEIYQQHFAFKEAKDAVDHVINFSINGTFVFRRNLEEERAAAPRYTERLQKNGILSFGSIVIRKVELR